MEDDQVEFHITTEMDNTITTVIMLFISITTNLVIIYTVITLSKIILTAL